MYIVLVIAGVEVDLEVGHAADREVGQGVEVDREEVGPSRVVEAVVRIAVRVAVKVEVRVEVGAEALLPVEIKAPPRRKVPDAHH